MKYENRHQRQLRKAFAEKVMIRHVYKHTFTDEAVHTCKEILSNPGIQADLVAEIKITLAENASEKHAGDKITWTREAREVLKELLKESHPRAVAGHGHTFLVQLSQRADALERALGLAPQEVSSSNVPAGLGVASSVVATAQSQEESTPVKPGGPPGLAMENALVEKGRPDERGRMARRLLELESECTRLRTDNHHLRLAQGLARHAQGQLVAEHQAEVQDLNALVEARDNEIRALNARLTDQAETIFRLVMAQYPEHERDALLARR
ncbi:hypothetical protein PV08_02139 [Exophiala spinifera]|uniref:Uncharacterized protein n=1 Tax=Exophiala spinifera TaxID=91928 RepID=A0A0D2CDG2_9EURO|nr:uncharacterized protein PV08_02139 [Exophiala spinifera]KIW21559.1 hypothetical protein PV08_02139 [Exophiala spinifera]